MKPALQQQIKKTAAEVVQICNDAWTDAGAEKKVEAKLTALAELIEKDKEG